MDGLDGEWHVGRELADEGAVLDGIGIRHGRLDSDTLRVNDHATFHTLVRVDPIQRILYFLRHLEVIMVGILNLYLL